MNRSMCNGHGNSFSNGEGAMPTTPGGQPLNNPAMAYEGVTWTQPGAVH